jgi:hypothetical protein
MEKIGINIEKLDKLLRDPETSSCIFLPHMGREWQLMAEHIVNAASFALKSQDIEKLKVLDLEAETCLTAWKEKTEKRSKKQ